LNGILSSALTALQTSQAALRTVSNNVANVNTEGYVRRVVNQEAQVSGTQLSGVDIADIQRVVDRFLNQEALAAQGTAAQYGAQNNIYTQLNGLIGQPGDGSALTSQLDDVFGALGAAALSPTSPSNQQNVLTAFQGLANTISTLSDSINGLQTQVDQQVTSSISTVNTLIKQIYSMNVQVQKATANGDDASGVLDQRDQALNKLSQLIGVRTSPGPNGQLIVSTQDGILLAGDTYAQLDYAGGASNGTYGPITLLNVNPSTGQSFGQPMPLDQHLASGTLKGLVEMRDGALADLKAELGAFARQTAVAFNTQHNANAAFPPPTSLDGRDTGLLATDALGFSGKTTIAVADSDGNLVSRIDVDFGGGTLTVDGGSPVSFGGTVGGFVTALNSALGANGTATFSDGKLSLDATGSNGFVIQDDASTPSSRAGSGFSQFFGLNDLFRTSSPSVLATGLTAGDSAGFAAGGKMDFSLKGPDGQIAKTASITLTGSETIGDIVTALNTAMGGTAIFALGADGTLSATPSSSYPGYKLNVTTDSTTRGTTGVSFSQLFGLGVTQAGAAASGFAVNSDIVNAPDHLAFAQSGITATSTTADSIVTSGDARGLVALQTVSSTKFAFAKAGGLGAQSASLSDYAANFYQDVAVRSQTAKTNNTAQTDRLTEVHSRQSSVSGVNIDEELTNMMTYQQAYSAGARVLQTVQSLFDTLLQIP
jgi:flagellar hook-associated protein 1 FlgK